MCGTGLGTFVLAPLEQWTLEHLGWRYSLMVLAGAFTLLEFDSCFLHHFLIIHLIFSMLTGSVLFRSFSGVFSVRTGHEPCGGGGDRERGAHRRPGGPARQPRLWAQAGQLFIR